jgi:hypothetical protein
MSEKKAQAQIIAAGGSSAAGNLNRSRQLNQYDPDRGHVGLSAAMPIFS